MQFVPTYFIDIYILEICYHVLQIQRKPAFFVGQRHTVKPVLIGHSKIDKTKILMTNGSLMKVKVLRNALLAL